MASNRPSERPWQLPDGIDELLPGEAKRAESLRRALLDTARSFGYQLVIPPMVEFTDSLLVGVGEDLDRLTFKVPDQVSGRMLGFRADMTPQVARMDAHSLGGDSINRLCYAGSTLHTRPGSLASSRSPMQLGAELYGAKSLAADMEVIDLMLTMLGKAGVPADGDLTLDLGHATIFRALMDASELSGSAQEEAVFGALQRKSRPELTELCSSLPEPVGERMSILMDLHGDVSVLDRARASLGGISAAIDRALDELDELAGVIQARYPALSLYLDLAELRGYHYHTGVVFAAYTRTLGESLARGGRYDDVGAVYGSARPATGFATDLRVLLRFYGDEMSATSAIAAPLSDDAALAATVTKLREEGECVICTLDAAADERCDRELVLIDGEWRVEAISASNAGAKE